MYAGWTVNLVRCIPLTMIQFVLFQNLRFMSKIKDKNEKAILSVKM